MKSTNPMVKECGPFDRKDASASDFRCKDCRYLRSISNGVRNIFECPKCYWMQLGHHRANWDACIWFEPKKAVKK